jgi:hypothetical protein
VIAAVLSEWTQEFVELWRDLAAVWRRERKKAPESRKTRRRTHRERSAARYQAARVNTHGSLPLYAPSADSTEERRRAQIPLAIL